MGAGPMIQDKLRLGWEAEASLYEGDGSLQWALRAKARPDLTLTGILLVALFR